MKSSHCPKYEQKNLKISALIPLMPWDDFICKFILKFPDLYMHALYIRFHISRLLYLKNSLSVRFSGQSSTVSPFIQHLFFLHFRELIWLYSTFLERRHSENESQKSQIRPEKNLQFSHIHKVNYKNLSYF